MVVGVKMFVYNWLVVAIHSVLVIGVLGSEKTLSDASDANVNGMYARFLEDLINTNEDKINAVKKLSHTKYNVKNYYKEDKSKPELDHLYRNQIGMLVVVPKTDSNEMNSFSIESDDVSSEESALNSDEENYHNHTILFLRDNVKNRFNKDSNSMNSSRSDVADSGRSFFAQSSNISNQNSGYFGSNLRQRRFKYDFSNKCKPRDASCYQNPCGKIFKNWAIFCYDNAAKICYHACKTAYQNACADNKARRRKRLLKNLKSNCRSACKRSFKPT